MRFFITILVFTGYFNCHSQLISTQDKAGGLILEFHRAHLLYITEQMWINGVFVIKDSKLTNATPGQWIKSNN